MTAQLTSLKVVCQLFTPHLILPESGCSEATAYAKERKKERSTDASDFLERLISEMTYYVTSGT